MSYADAARFYDVMKAEREIARDDKRGLLEKTRDLAALNQRVGSPHADYRFRMGDVIKGAIGAGIGYGLMRAYSNGMHKHVRDTLSNLGAQMGAAMHTQFVKSAEEAGASLERQVERIDELGPKLDRARTDAFKLGFVRALVETGYFNEKRAAIMPIPVMALSPSNLLQVPRNLAKAITGGGEVAGSAIGTLDAMDEDDFDIAKINAERVILEQQLERLKQDRRNAALKAILAKRRSKT